MKVVQHTETELVVQDSTLWIAALMGAAAPFLVYGALVTGKKAPLLTAGLFLFFAFLALRKITVVFDSVRGIATWKRFRYLKTSTVSLPFNEIEDIVLQSSLSSQGDRSTYRLAILTTQGSHPLSESYGINRDMYTSVRTEILQFLKPGATPAPAQEQSKKVVDWDSSIHALLAQGRKMDAITMLTSMKGMDLTAAKQRVEEIERQMQK